MADTSARTLRLLSLLQAQRGVDGGYQLEWPMMLLGALGAEFEVISPELLDGLRDWARRFSHASRVAGEPAQ